MLSIDNLSIEFNRRQILRDININIETGNLVSVLGPNGAGKSTLLRAILGMLPLQAGSIEWDGKCIHPLSEIQKSKLISYLPQSLQSPSSIKVFDFVSLGNYPWLKESTPTELENRVEDAMDLCQIKPYGNKCMNTLSGGERQRVYLAQTVVQHTQVLLLDEPAVYLDIKHQLEIDELISSLMDQNKLILYVSHDVHSAYRISTKTLMLKKGRVFQYGDTNETITAESLAELYDVNVSHFQNGLINTNTNKERNKCLSVY